jgi:NAD(P)-dependent dehydrogenase (short-subunit alcohol dehydrogenase family)
MSTGSRTPRVERWRDAHVLVTGGSSGIGRAFVRQVVARGAHVSVLALPDDDLGRTAEELGPPHQVVGVDVTDHEAVHDAVRRVTAALGPGDVLLTCAGIAHPGYFGRLDDDVFRRTMEIDYFGTLHAMRAVVPDMVARRHGSVVGISSAAGLIGVFGYSAYAPAKSAGCWRCCAWSCGRWASTSAACARRTPTPRSWPTRTASSRRRPPPSRGRSSRSPPTGSPRASWPGWSTGGS